MATTVKAVRRPAVRSRSGSSTRPRASWLRRLLLLGLVGLIAFAAYEYLTLPSAEPLRTENPQLTALMRQREAEARAAGRKPRRRQYWVGLSSLSKHAIAAVVLSEDARFYEHEGVDTVELRNALEESMRQGRLGRGASTLTQQLAKNLWLSTDRSLLRKAKELLLSFRLEEALTKKRILTLYLNVVEWGEGVYGLEAAAREHFGVSASKLSPAQGAILAAMLPAPRKRSPSSGSPRLRQRAHWIVDQMTAVRRLSAEEARAAHEEIDRLLVRKKPTSTRAVAADDDGEEGG
jgi:monofunctional glycosyltransferase